MSSEIFDIVIPLHRIRWNTRAVLEALTFHYNPRSIHIITTVEQIRAFNELSQDWQTAPLFTHDEEVFFQEKSGLTKDDLCAELDLDKSLYSPGWFYQQLIKLGAFESIEDLSNWYVVWDSDLLPVDAWALIQEQEQITKHTFALIQDKRWGNPNIVSQWQQWINNVLGVEAVINHQGTFIPHHMWFKQEHLQSLTTQVNKYYQSTDHWLKLMMRSIHDFGSFSEYWSYVSWVSTQAPHDLSFYPYELYGSTAERFFDDGSGLFSTTFKNRNSIATTSHEPFFPSYAEINAFIKAEYGLDSLPSCLSFESSPRHLKKGQKNMHLEELRSRWGIREKIGGEQK